MLAGTAIVAGACAGSANTATTTPRSSGDPAGVVVDLDEYRFVPSTLSVGADVSVDVRNLGGLEHTWSVLADPIDGERELVGSTKLLEVRLEVGQSASIELDVLPAGVYQLVCAIPGHFSAGMIGELVVTSS
jgi:plastocyanin